MEKQNKLKKKPKIMKYVLIFIISINGYMYMVYQNTQIKFLTVRWFHWVEWCSLSALLSCIIMSMRSSSLDNDDDDGPPPMPVR